MQCLPWRYRWRLKSEAFPSGLRARRRRPKVHAADRQSIERSAAEAVGYAPAHDQTQVFGGKQGNKRTSGSGQSGSLRRATSAGLRISMRTSCETLSLRPIREAENISRFSTATSFFLASFITTSSAAAPGSVRGRSTCESASAERATEILLSEFD